MMFETVDSIGDKLVEVFNEKLETLESLDVREWAAKFTADVIGSFFMNEDFLKLCIVGSGHSVYRNFVHLLTKS